MSCMYNQYKQCPSTDPCGTIAEDDDDHYILTTTHEKRPDP